MNSKPLIDKSELSRQIKAEAARLGFFACGIAHAEAVDEETAHEVRRWLSEGRHAGMDYMNNYTDKRLDPRLLMPGVQSIVSVALNYAPVQRIPQEQYQLAGYAYGQDYHDIVKTKLRSLATHFGLTPYPSPSNPSNSLTPSSPSFRVFCDSAPILERYWAVKAGLGWTGRNHQLILPQAGSQFVLGELFLDIPLQYDQEMPSRCSSCHRCLEACPTHALGTWNPHRPHQRQPLDAHRCLSYQTIENREDLNPTTIQAMGNTIYGCDRCQTACPWNRLAPPTDIPELQPRTELLEMTREKWLRLSEDDYRRLFKGSAVKRAKYTGLMRNINAVGKKE